MRPRRVKLAGGSSGNDACEAAAPGFMDHVPHLCARQQCYAPLTLRDERQRQTISFRKMRAL